PETILCWCPRLCSAVSFDTSRHGRCCERRAGAARLLSRIGGIAGRATCFPSGRAQVCWPDSEPRGLTGLARHACKCKRHHTKVERPLTSLATSHWQTTRSVFLLLPALPGSPEVSGHRVGKKPRPFYFLYRRQRTPIASLPSSCPRAETAPR